MIYKGYEYQVNNFSFLDSQIKWLIDYLEENKPLSICELGAGVTTDIFNQYLQRNLQASLISIEHDPKYKTDHTILCNLIDHGTIRIGHDQFRNVNYYSSLEDTLKNQQFDLVLIDGPFSYDPKYQFTRVQMLYFIYDDLLCDNSTFIIHDTQRQSTKRTIFRFKYRLNKMKYKIISTYINHQNSDKEMTVFKIKREKS